jgi:hypothetical protein
VTISTSPTFLPSLEALRAAMRRPTFQRLLLLARGFVLATGSHTVAAALLAGDIARGHHHEAFHRFFSRRCWSPDELGRLLLLRLVALLRATSLTVAIDDTLAPKKGPKVFGLGTHLDAVRSTRRHRIFAFGHVWVVLAVLVKMPMATRPWALPILFRLYRNERECAKRGDLYRKKTELARAMLDELLSWTELPVRVVADVAYCNATLQRGHDARVVFVGTMRPDAVLTALPTAAQRKKTGRRRVKGSVLPKPEKLAANARKPWQPARATLYGKERVVHIKTMRAQWYIACGEGLLHVVLVRLDHGRIPFRTFFSSDPALDAVDILETYAGRWSIEVAFRNLKQHLGFADSPARLRRAVERTAPFVGLLYTSLVLWFLEHAGEQPLALVPVRTWYRHKATLSFEDVLRAARSDLLLPVSDPLCPSDNLKNCHEPSKSPSVYRPRP